MVLARSTYGGGGSRAAALVVAAIVAIGIPARPAASQDDETCSPSRPEVRSVGFRGNHALHSRVLVTSLETAPSSRLRRWTRVMGARRCLSPDTLIRDVARLLLLYRRSGYPRAVVDTAIDRSRGRVRFVIQEGDPLLVDSVVITGVTVDSLRNRLADEITLAAHDPLNRFALEKSAAEVGLALRQRGYLTARVTPRTEVDSVARHGYAALDVELGPRVRLGKLTVTSRGQDGGAPRVAESAVRSLTRLRDGQVLRLPDLTAARRNLENSGIYGQVALAVTRADREGNDATANVEARLVEGDATELRVNAGFGTLDCFRLNTQLERTAFLRPNGRLELTGVMSKIAIGDPLDFAPGVCSDAAQEDPYSRNLNYYVGATYRHPGLAPRGATRSLSIYTERRSEYFAYMQTTYLGGNATISRPLSARWSVSGAYDLTYGRTEAEPAVLCAVFSACLPDDRARFGETKPFGLITGGLAYSNTDSPSDPQRGRTARFDMSLAPSWAGTSPEEQIIGARTDLAMYRRIARRTVVALRLRLGIVSTYGSGEFVPQQERLFAGGATTVRGFGQNQVGPRVYLADSVRVVTSGPDTLLWALPPDSTGWRVVPTGGDRSIVAGIELRRRLPVFGDALQLVAFVDGGAVWNRGDAPGLASLELQVTPGIGLRAFTPIGPVRLDVGYNSYPPEAGPAYRDQALGFETAPLYCVSPGNTLPVTGFGKTDAAGQPLPPVQAEGSCPASYAPTRPQSFGDRLTLHLSIGQAF